MESYEKSSKCRGSYGVIKVHPRNLEKYYVCGRHEIFTYACKHGMKLNRKTLICEENSFRQHDPQNYDQTINGFGIQNQHGNQFKHTTHHDHENQHVEQSLLGVLVVGPNIPILPPSNAASASATTQYPGQATIDSESRPGPTGAGTGSFRRKFPSLLKSALNKLLKLFRRIGDSFDFMTTEKVDVTEEPSFNIVETNKRTEKTENPFDNVITSNKEAAPGEYDDPMVGMAGPMFPDYEYDYPTADAAKEIEMESVKEKLPPSSAIKEGKTEKSNVGITLSTKQSATETSTEKAKLVEFISTEMTEKKTSTTQVEVNVKPTTEQNNPPTTILPSIVTRIVEKTRPVQNSTDNPPATDVTLAGPNGAATQLTETTEDVTLAPATTAVPAERAKIIHEDGEKFVEYYNVYEYYDLADPDTILFEKEIVNGTTQVVNVKFTTPMTPLSS